MREGHGLGTATVKMPAWPRTMTNYYGSGQAKVGASPFPRWNAFQSGMTAPLKLFSLRWKSNRDQSFFSRWTNAARKLPKGG
jgi:hypothetical protein